MKYLFSLIIISSVLFSQCTPPQQKKENTSLTLKEKELELRERELALKEKEFQLKEKQLNREPLTDNKEIWVDEEAEIKAIQDAYKTWFDNKVKNNQYWTQTQWDQYQASWRDRDKYADNSDYHEQCVDGLPKQFSHSAYGDINQDGYLDFIGQMQPLFCFEGTWSTHVYSQFLIVSNTKKSYTVKDVSEVFMKEIKGICLIKKIEPDGTIIYDAYEYEDPDGPTVIEEWKAKVKYNNGNFKLVTTFDRVEYKY